MRILCVDDSRAIHAYMTEIFKDSGTELVHAYHGREAADVLARDRNFDIVLLDWEMPELDGPGTLDALAGLGVALPVVMVTTRNDFQDIATALGKGAADYVMKPFTRDILFEKIQSITGRQVA